MAQWLRALPAFPGDWTSVLRTNMAAHNCLGLHFQRMTVSSGFQWHQMYKHMYRPNNHIHKIMREFVKIPVASQSDHPRGWL